MVSLLLLSFGSLALAHPVDPVIPWQAGPHDTLRALGTITRLRNITREKALYLLTGHGTANEPVLSLADTGTVPDATVCFSRDRTSCLQYPFLARFYAPGTEPLKLTLHERVWIESNTNWRVLRVFPCRSKTKRSPAVSAATSSS